MADPNSNSDRPTRLSRLDGDIVCVTLDMSGSSANILSAAFLDELELRLEEIREMDGLKGLILISAKPRIFVAGADLKEIRDGLDWPDERIEAFANRGRRIYDGFGQFDFPSVAAIHGACVGGGLELALGCNQRVATSDRRTILGLPETKLGLIPGWGGTVRVPRIVGLKAGLQMIVKGKTATAAESREMGLVNQLVHEPDDLIRSATRLIQIAQQAGDFRTDRAKIVAPIDINESQRQQIGEQITADGFAQSVVRSHILDSCTMSFEDACQAEAQAFAKTWGSDESHGLLNHFFLGEHNRKQPGFVDLSITAAPIQTVGVIGAGLMGRGIAQSSVGAGKSVVLYDIDSDLCESVVQELSGEGQTISVAQEFSAFTDCDLVIETIVESVEVKRQVLDEIVAVCNEQTIIASNTSSIPIGELALSHLGPERICGIHFCHPRLMKLVEVVCGEQTSPQTTATATQFVRSLRKMPVVVKDGPGFVVNRVLSAMLDQAVRLFTWGEQPETIDAAMREFGFDAGPFEIIDIIGADTCLNAGVIMGERGVQCVNNTPVIPRMVKRKRLGRKTGLGFYRYASADASPENDPEIEKLLEAFRQESPGTDRECPESENRIADQILSAMVQESCRILTEGLVADPKDIDLCMIHGLGFPADQGGLLFWAKRKPVQHVIEVLNWLATSEVRFEPSEYLFNVQKGVASI